MVNNNAVEFQVPTRFAKIDFPRFDSDKCERFFELDKTLAKVRVKMAAIHLEGNAMQWHQSYVKTKAGEENVRWKDYVRALETRFGEQSYDDPMANLKNLKQKDKGRCVHKNLLVISY